MNKLYQSIMGNRQNTAMNGLMSAMKGNPEAFKNAVINNPQFQTFLANNKGKSPEQIAKENGIDFNMVKNLMR